MSKKINCIMLVDDNADDNFFHARIIRKNDSANVIITQQTGRDAINYLKNKTQHEGQHPDLIFLDINMPAMNGWEFLKEYEKLDQDLQCKVVVVMLTSSDNPEDKERAREQGVALDFKSKPLTKEILDEIIDMYC